MVSTGNSPTDLLKICHCQCHQYSQAKTPGWMRSVFGSVFVRYNSVPFLNTRACDSSSGQQRSETSVQLQYIFPQWLLARAVYLVTSWDRLTGLGSDIHLRYPRILPPDHGALNAIMANDSAWFKRAITTRSILPADLFSDGDSLIMVRVKLTLFHCTVHYT